MIRAENIMIELQNPKNWKRTSKKNYEVYVCRPKLGHHAYNRLEDVHYTTNENKQFKISGTVGEEGIIDIDILAKTYCFIDGSPITLEALSKRADNEGIIDWMHLKTLPGGGTTNWAFHLPLEIKNFPVQTLCNDILYANRDGVEHGKGDFLVCSDINGQPNINDVWVVNGEVFPTTYDMRAFPGMLDTQKLTVITPKPESIKNLRDEDEKWRNKYISQVTNTLNQLLNSVTRVTGLEGKSLAFREFKHGLDGNYIIGDDYDYYDYVWNALLNNGRNLKIRIRVGNKDDIQYEDCNIGIWLDTGTSGSSLGTSRSCESIGPLVRNLKESTIEALIRQAFGMPALVTSNIDTTKSINNNNNKKKKSGLFNLFKR